MLTSHFCVYFSLLKTGLTSFVLQLQQLQSRLKCRKPGKTMKNTNIIKNGRSATFKQFFFDLFRFEAG